VSRDFFLQPRVFPAYQNSTSEKEVYLLFILTLITLPFLLHHAFINSKA